MDDHDELEFYRDKKDEIRWRYKAAGNNEIVADSAEGYNRLIDAMTAAYRVVGLSDPRKHALTASAGGVAKANRGDGTHVDVVFSHD